MGWSAQPTAQPVPGCALKGRVSNKQMWWVCPSCLSVHHRMVGLLQQGGHSFCVLHEIQEWWRVDRPEKVTERYAIWWRPGCQPLKYLLSSYPGGISLGVSLFLSILVDFIQEHYVVFTKVLVFSWDCGWTGNFLRKWTSFPGLS